MCNKLKKILLTFLITTSFHTANATDGDNFGIGRNTSRSTIIPKKTPSKVGLAKDIKNNLGNPLLPNTPTFGSSPIYSSSTHSAAPVKSLTDFTTSGSPVNSGKDSTSGFGVLSSVPTFTPTSTGSSSGGSLFSSTSSPAPLVPSPLSSPPMFGVTSASGKGNAGNSTTNPSSFGNSSFVFGSPSSPSSSILNPPKFTTSIASAPLVSSTTYGSPTSFGDTPTFNPPALRSGSSPFNSASSPIFSNFNLTSSTAVVEPFPMKKSSPYTPVATSPATRSDSQFYSPPPLLTPSFSLPSPTVFGASAPLRSNSANYSSIATFDSPDFDASSSPSRYAPIREPSISSPISPNTFGTPYASGKSSTLPLRNFSGAPTVTHSYEFTHPTSYPPVSFNTALLKAANKLYDKTILTEDPNFQNMHFETWKNFYQEFNTGAATSVSIINWLVEVREEVNKKRDEYFYFKENAINESILNIFGGCWGIRKATLEDNVSGLKDILRGTIHLKLEDNNSRMKAIAQQWCGKISNRNAIDDFENSHFITLITYYGAESSHYSHSQRYASFNIEDFERDLQNWLARNTNKNQLISRILETVKREESDRNNFINPGNVSYVPSWDHDKVSFPDALSTSGLDKPNTRFNIFKMDYTSEPSKTVKFSPATTSRSFSLFDDESEEELFPSYTPKSSPKIELNEEDGSDRGDYSDDEYEEEDEEEEDGSAYGSDKE